jgi:hypothetical protein
MSIFTTISNQPAVHVLDPYTIKNGAYFSIDRSCEAALASFDEPQRSTLRQLIDVGSWQMLISNFTEQHVDASTVINTLSDSFVAFASGAMPIAVEMQGYVYMLNEEDHRLDFIGFYTDFLRGTMLQRWKLILNFFIRGTYFQLQVTDLDVQHASNMEDVAMVSMRGIGCRYGIVKHFGEKPVESGIQLVTSEYGGDGGAWA